LEAARAAQRPLGDLTLVRGHSPASVGSKRTGADIAEKALAHGYVSSRGDGPKQNWPARSTGVHNPRGVARAPPLGSRRGRCGDGNNVARVTFLGERGTGPASDVSRLHHRAGKGRERMSLIGTFTALVAFAAKPRSAPVVDPDAELLEAELLDEALARIEELESANAQMTVERDRARDCVLEISDAYHQAHGRVSILEERLARYEGRQPHPMSHFCCVPSRTALLMGTSRPNAG
jgi:hypothetical protein